jgi:hypothetical protein
MIDNTSGEVLVVLTTPPEIGELIVDWLLARDAPLGFTSTTVAGHSTRHDGLSTAEQVRGSQERLQFQVQMPAADADDFLSGAAEAFGAAGIHYWSVPVLAGGQLGR